MPAINTPISRHRKSSSGRPLRSRSHSPDRSPPLFSHDNEATLLTALFAALFATLLTALFATLLATLFAALLATPGSTILAANYGAEGIGGDLHTIHFFARSAISNYLEMCGIGRAPMRAPSNRPAGGGRIENLSS